MGGGGGGGGQGALACNLRGQMRDQSLTAYPLCLGACWEPVVTKRRVLRHLVKKRLGLSVDLAVGVAVA